MNAVARQDGGVAQLQAQLARACDERDEALERVCQLEDLLMARDAARLPALGLSPEQSRVFATLLRWPVVSREQLMALLYGHRDDPPQDKILDQHMLRIRRKVKPHGIVIDTIWGRGWALDDASRARLKQGDT